MGLRSRGPSDPATPAHPLRPRPPENDARPQTTTVDALAQAAPVPKAELRQTVHDVNAVGRQLGLSPAAMLEHLRLNILGLAHVAGPSAHFLEVGAAGRRSAPVWARMIDALEDGDRSRLQKIVQATPDGPTQLEDLLLHYRFTFSPDAVRGWIDLAGDLSRLSDRDFGRVDVLRDLNRLELSDDESRERFVARARAGLADGHITKPNIEALIAAHASYRLQRREGAGPVDGNALRNATVGAVRALAELGQLPSLHDKRVTVVLVESEGDEASRVSLRQKAKLFGDLGLDEGVVMLPPDTDLATLRNHIAEANADPNNLGTIVQLPIPEALRPALDDIEPHKDIDGIGGRSVHPCPATAEAAVRAVTHAVDPGEKVLVVGSAGFVGSGVMVELDRLGIDAVVYELSDNRDPRRDRALAARLTRENVTAIISAANRADVVSPEWCARYGIDPGQLKMIVDVGFVPGQGTARGRAGQGTARGRAGGRGARPSGSVTEAIKGRTAHTPVPGGVGPMEMAVLAERTVSALLGRQVRLWSVGDNGKVTIERGWSSPS